MAKDPDTIRVILPPELQRLMAPAGAHRRGMKILAFGESGGGKSYFAASLPRPLAVAECGEGGIQPYLLPPEKDKDGKYVVNMERVMRGEEDLVFRIEHPSDFGHFVDFVTHPENLKWLRSASIDPMNAQWEDHMNFYNDKFGGEIAGGQWRFVKGDWKLKLKKLMRSPLNVCMTAWLKDTLYERVEKVAGADPVLNIRPQEVAQIEKSVPYTVDLTLQCSVKRDRLNKPQATHIIEIAKCRRPRSIPPTELFVGKKWSFSAKNPKSPWDTIVTPLAELWEDGALDYLGMDAEEAIHVGADLTNNAENAELGRISLLIAGEFKSVNEFKACWDRDIASQLESLSPKHRAQILRLKEERKQELMNTKGGSR